MDEDRNMFSIIPKSADEALEVLFLLSPFNVECRTTSDCENESSVVITVYEDVKSDSFRLAEMTFQMNYRQVGIVCPICSDEGEDVCGHLIFSGKI